ncbi:hypothetical protein [Pontimicrobium sp. MEBiC01747]|jgi:hypothetical protein
MNQKLNDVKFNAIAIIIVEIIACSITFSVDYSNIGMASVIIKWIPAIIGVITLFIYFASRLVLKKYNWCISLLGIIIMLVVAINIYNTDFSESLSVVL